MPRLSEAALTIDFMDLDESTDPVPPVQTEVAETRDEGVGMEDEDVKPQNTPVPTSVPPPDYSPPDEQPLKPNQMTEECWCWAPGCFTPSRVFFLEDPEFNRDLDDRVHK